MAWLIAYGVCVLVMGGLDFIWLSSMSGPLYHREVGAVMAENPNMTAAVVFYLLYIAGILVFAVRRAGQWRLADGGAVRGAVRLLCLCHL